MNFSIFSSANTMAGDTSGTACNCLVGTPYIDAAGNCRCTDANGTVPPASSPKNDPFAPGGIYYIFNAPAGPPAATGTAAAAAAGPTIFGLPANMVYIGGALAALFLFSKMDGGKTK